MCSHRRKRVLGLIGGIGSGKSAVAAVLTRRGAQVIVADRLGHQALLRPEVKQQLLERWGPDVCDEQGNIDRRRVAEIVFADPTERQALENVVFPYIESGMDALIAEAQQDPQVRWIVLDAAILLETGWARRCDWIVFVHAPRRQRLERLIGTRGWSEKEVRQRSQAQLPLTEKVSQAHFVVDNSGPIAELSRQVDQLLARPELSDCQMTSSLT
jgi:dephospho-CoA kinase